MVTVIISNISAAVFDVGSVYGINHRSLDRALRDDYPGLVTLVALVAFPP